MLEISIDYLSRLREMKDISPKIRKKEIKQVKEDIKYLKEEILSSHFIKKYRA